MKQSTPWYIANYSPAEISIASCEILPYLTEIEVREKKAGAAAILEATKQYRDKVLSHTYNNGKEFAMHELLTEVMEAQAYFAHPYHWWERSLNESTNGLIRQYFPKKTDFSTINPKDEKEVQDKPNRRPRKCLGFQTPK